MKKYASVLTLIIVFFIVAYPCFAYEIDYDDDYTHSYGDSSDGIVWGGGDLDVRVDGISWWDKKAVCFDWCDDGFLDACFCV